MKTAEEILEWAYDVRQHVDELFAGDPPHAGDIATAEYFAECVRLREAFDMLTFFVDWDAAVKRSTGRDQTMDLGKVFEHLRAAMAPKKEEG